jgi:hypothetical protein
MDGNALIDLVQGRQRQSVNARSLGIAISLH